MKTIRQNCFETNSSSTHSLTLNSTPKDLYEYEGCLKDVEACVGEFSWDFRLIEDVETKVSYFWTLAQCDKKMKQKMQEVSRITGLILVEPSKDDFYMVYGGTHHYEQACKDNSFLKSINGMIEFFIGDSLLTTEFD